MQNDWNTTKLGNHIQTLKGYAFKSEWYSDKGVPLVKVSDFTGDSIDTTRLTRVPDEIAANYSKYEVKKDDVVIQTVGSWPTNPQSVVGKVIRVPRKANGALLNQNAVKIIPDESIDKKFLFYVLRSSSFKNYIIGCAQGAASQASITLDAIRKYAFSFPKLEHQRRIAALLSAYDDLIENNTRRIQILEEMARRIHEEWFVRFRFPGHENLSMVESELGLIPEEWEVKRLGDVCVSLTDGDWIETKDQSGVAYRLLQVSNIGVSEFVETGNYRYVTQETFESLRCQEVVPGDILIARMPRPTGRAWVVTAMPWRMITAVDVAILRHDSSKVDLMFLAYLLNSEHHLALVSKHTTGTTRPRISRSSLSALKIIVPLLALQAKFGSFAIGNYHLMSSLRKKNINLRAARDLLLPKLISGEIDVSNFPEPVTD